MAVLHLRRRVNGKIYLTTIRLYQLWHWLHHAVFNLQIAFGPTTTIRATTAALVKNATHRPLTVAVRLHLHQPDVLVILELFHVKLIGGGKGG